MKILKYPLAVGKKNAIAIQGVMPTAFQPRFVEDQHGIPTLWLGVDDKSPHTSMINIHVVGTGHDYSPDWAYLGSCKSGIFVWHIFFEEKR